MDQSTELGTLPGDWNGPSVQSIPDSSACEKESRGQQGGKMISFGFKHSSKYGAKRNILEMEVTVSSHGRQILEQAYSTTRPKELVVSFSSCGSQQPSSLLLYMVDSCKSWIEKAPKLFDFLHHICLSYWVPPTNTRSSPEVLSRGTWNPVRHIWLSYTSKSGQKTSGHLHYKWKFCLSKSPTMARHGQYRLIEWISSNW